MDKEAILATKLGFKEIPSHQGVSLSVVLPKGQLENWIILNQYPGDRVWHATFIRKQTGATDLLATNVCTISTLQQLNDFFITNVLASSTDSF
ncbi:hypothetical protein GCM10027578_21930 [Spirosoma luteolum]